jgi:hypothetical protein
LIAGLMMSQQAKTTGSTMQKIPIIVFIAMLIFDWL